MSEYGMAYFDVLKLPVRTFWSLNRQVNRLRAERDMRSMRVAGASQSAEGAKAMSEALMAELETPILVEKQFDEDRFLEIQAKLGAIRNQHAEAE